MTYARLLPFPATAIGLAMLLATALVALPSRAEDPAPRAVGCFPENPDADPLGIGGRDLDGAAFKDASMTRDRCLSLCAEQGFRFAGLQDGSWCFCGDSYGRYGAESESCTTECAGDPDQVCGGSLANSIWELAGAGTLSGGGAGSEVPSGEVADVARSAWTALQHPPEACDGMREYTGEEGLRALYCYVRDFVDYEKLEVLAGIPVFVSAPHTDYQLRFQEDRFGHYNRDFVLWAQSNLLPSPNDAAFIEMTQPSYNKYLRRMARAYHRTYVQLSNNLGHFKRERQYLMEMIEGTRPWSYLGARWQAEDLRRILNLDVEAEELNWYHVDTAIRFWQRRSIDQTADAFFAGLERLMAIYDKAYLDSAPRPAGNAPHLPPPGAISDLDLNPAGPSLPEPQGPNLRIDNLLHAPL
jgi:hypothetical protein